MVNYDYFTQAELQCHCSYPECDGGEMSPAFMVRVIDLRKFLDFPFPVSSGFRCARHNTDVGGRSNSLHLLGQAIDIGIDRDRAYQLVADAKNFGMRGIGVRQVGSKRFVHIDNRPQDHVSFWSY